jgi:hypothetical protein
MMKVMRLDEMAFKYMEEKYYKNNLSGLVGKIFDIDESTIDPVKFPGQARCRYCSQLFAKWRSKKRHESSLRCVKGEEFTRVNRIHI